MNKSNEERTLRDVVSDSVCYLYRFNLRTQEEGMKTRIFFPALSSGDAQEYDNPTYA